jgi:virulence-associated protein VapD
MTGRRYTMKKIADEYNKMMRLLLIVGAMILLGAGLSYAEKKAAGAAGQTGYTIVKNIDAYYLITDQGRFYVSEDTEIYNQDAVKIKFSDIKKSCVVDILYMRIDGELNAMEIIAKTKPEETLPE